VRICVQTGALCLLFGLNRSQPLVSRAQLRPPQFAQLQTRVRKVSTAGHCFAQRQEPRASAASIKMRNRRGFKCFNRCGHVLQRASAPQILCLTCEIIALSPAKVTNNIRERKGGVYEHISSPWWLSQTQQSESFDALAFQAAGAELLFVIYAAPIISREKAY
jgi:hypothetical protein